MELVVKNLNEVNQFMEAVKLLVLKADVSKNNIKGVDEISGEIVLGDDDNQTRIHVADDQSENKYDSFNRGNKSTEDLNGSITNSPDLSTKNNDKPERATHTDSSDKMYADFIHLLEEAACSQFGIRISELDDRD